MFFDIIFSNVISNEPPGFFEYFCLGVGFIFIILNIKQLISSIKNSQYKIVIISQSAIICILMFLFIITFLADITGINEVTINSDSMRVKRQGVFINNIIFNLLNCLIIPITLQIILSIKLKKKEERNV